jgi:hypothetical protein
MMRAAARYMMAVSPAGCGCVCARALCRVLQSMKPNHVGAYDHVLYSRALRGLVILMQIPWRELEREGESEREEAERGQGFQLARRQYDPHRQRKRVNEDASNRCVKRVMGVKQVG